MKLRSPRRGIPWAHVPAEVDRVLIIRTGVLVRRTNLRSQYGTPQWVDRNGKHHGYGGLVHVKPVYKYDQIFGAKK